jgi:threonine dehydrogenase-like Zn-dependent dehydrogenase
MPRAGVRGDDDLDTYLAAAIKHQAVEFIRLPIREPAKDEVLVQVRACALCTWELRTYSGKAQTSRPLLGGHEIAGEVVAMGPGTTSAAAVGDRVAVRRMGQCNACRGCWEGRECRNRHLGVIDTGTHFGPQGLGEYLTVAASQVFPMANELSYAEAALTEPVACVLRGIVRARIEFGDDVVIFGAGFMGMAHARLARLQGARVLLVEPDETRRAAAESLGERVVSPDDPGFEAGIRETTDGGPAVAVVTGGGRVAVEQATRITADGGRIMAYGATYPPAPAELDTNRVHYRELEIVGTSSQSAAEFRRAGLVLSRGIVDMSPLISASFPIGEVEDGLRAALDSVPYRVIITLDES